MKICLYHYTIKVEKGGIKFVRLDRDFYSKYFLKKQQKNTTKFNKIQINKNYTTIKYKITSIVKNKS